MKITIEPTEQFFESGHVMLRKWLGTDEAGIPVLVLTAAVATVEQGFFDRQELISEDGLKSIPTPDADHPARAVLPAAMRKA